MRHGPEPFAAALMAAAVLAATCGAARADLRLVAPRDGAVLAGSPARLLVAGGGKVKVTLNGRAVAGVSQQGEATTVSLALAPGRNRLALEAGDARVEATLVLDAAAGKAYRYHDPVEGGDCKACHPQGVGRTFPVNEARFCYACHDSKSAAKVLHGPIGAGQCTVCHDPHGSAQAALLVSETAALCRSCHDQSRSRDHIERSSSRACPECHDPHGSEKKYLLY